MIEFQNMKQNREAVGRGHSSELPNKPFEGRFQGNVLTGKKSPVERLLPNALVRTGRTMDLGMGAYGVGTAITNKIPGANNLTRLVSEIPHSQTVAHALHVPTREMTAAALLVLGGDTVRRVALNATSKLRTRSMNKKYEASQNEVS